MQPPAKRNAASSLGGPPRQPRQGVETGRGTQIEPAGRNQIVLVGASIRSAAQSARRAGLGVIGIDLFADTDTLAACDRYFAIDAAANSDQIVRACRGIPIIQVGGLNSHDSLIKRLEAVCPSPRGLGADSDRLRDLGYLRQIATAAGMRFPPTFDPATFSRAAAARGPWLCKHRRGCGGLGVRWHTAASAMDDHVIQKWIPGRVYGATLLCDGNRAELLGVCRTRFTRRRVTRRGRPDSGLTPFLYCGSLGPLRVSSDVSQLLIRLGQQIVATTNYRGPVNADFVLDRSGIAWLLEINPRWSGSSELIERRLVDQNALADHSSLLWLMIRAMEGSDLSGCADIANTGAPSPIYLKRIVMARRDMRFELPKSGSLKSGSLKSGSLHSDESIHDVPRQGTVIRRGDPVCTLIRRIESRGNDTMRRHRLIVRQFSGLSARYSPRSSA